MALHKDLTGEDLHEPKGIEAAAGGTVYVANGSGSGSWSSRLSGILNLNTYYLTQPIIDISTVDDRAIFYVPIQSELVFVNAILKGAITTANAVLSIYINGILHSETLTLPFSGSTTGTNETLTVAVDNTLPAGSIVEVRSNGASDTATLAFVTVGLRAK